MMNVFQGNFKSHLKVLNSTPLLILSLLLFSCVENEPLESSDGIKEENSEQSPSTSSIKENVVYESPIIGERIDGPANIRNKPNGEVLFELYDDVRVESTSLNGDWYEILIHADINFDEVGMNAMKEGREVFVDGKKVGKILKTANFATGHGRDKAYVMLNGFSHKNNIRPNSIIENSFVSHLEKGKREYNHWRTFIKEFQLEKEGISYKKLQTYFNYESGIENPSSGFRMVLLFENKDLIGWMHSRKMNPSISNLTTKHLIYGSSVTFFNDYPENKQLDFIAYMNEWIKSVS